MKQFDIRLFLVLSKTRQAENKRNEIQYYQYYHLETSVYRQVSNCLRQRPWFEEGYDSE